MPKETYKIDARGKTLGRVASEAALILTGKRSTSYQPNIKPNHQVIVTNAKKIRLSGNKSETKTYKRYSGYPGGLKYIAFEKMFERSPALVIQKAVMGMLPKNKLRKHTLSNLTIHNGPENNN